MNKIQKTTGLAALAVPVLCGCSSDTVETSAMNTLMGIGTVFGILVLISLLIYCFKIIPYIQRKIDEKKEPLTKPEDYVDRRILTPEPKQPPKKEDDAELVAVIAAAIASETGLDPNAFVVRRIRRIK